MARAFCAHPRTFTYVFLIRVKTCYRQRRPSSEMCLSMHLYAVKGYQMRLLFINKQHKYKTPAALKPPFHHESPPDPEREGNPTNLTVYLTETTPKNLNVLTADGAPAVLSLNLLLNSLRRLARSQPSSSAKRYRLMSTKPGHSQGVECAIGSLSSYRLLEINHKWSNR